MRIANGGASSYFWIAVDDYIFDLKSKYDIELSFDAIDETVEEALKVAKIKFV